MKLKPPINVLPILSAPMLLLFPPDTFALAPLPEQAGFEGYVIVGGGYMRSSSNMIVGTTITEITDSTIDSLTQTPSSRDATTVNFLGEVSYTFPNVRTQVFASQLFTDYIRYDVTDILGVRQKFNKLGTIGLSYVFSVFATQVWKDPYVVNVDRNDTDRNQYGWRLTWERLFDTQATIQYTARNIDIEERSGQTQLSLTNAESQLLDRNGDLHEWLLSYRLKLSENHSLSPELLFDRDDTKGKAMNATRTGLRLLHTYINRKIGVVISTSAGYTTTNYDKANPIYNKTRSENRISLDLTYLQFGIWRHYQSQLALATNLFYYYENTNIDFYDSKFYGINLSLLYKF